MMSNESHTRDQLALERTQLANERTLLAYFRTGLALLAAATLLLHFVDSFDGYMPLAWLCIVLGLTIFTVGIIRFFSVRKRLNQ